MFHLLMLINFFTMIGGSGYIGKYVVKESVKRGYKTTVVQRKGSPLKDEFFQGANIVYGDVCDFASINQAFDQPYDVVISCLASSNLFFNMPLSTKIISKI